MIQDEYGQIVLNEDDVMEQCYATAVRMNPRLQSQVAAEQQAAEHAKTLVAQAKNAAVQVNGAPSSAPVTKPNPLDRRAVIANALGVSR